ncbi:MAG: hypothetical protein EBU00_11900 [Alphaproteobacteria bacterium]|nr:hypothetical protein [Alphaproteobacteria bacterium]
MVENRNEVASSSRIGKVLFALVVAAVIFGLGFQVGRIGKPALVDQAINIAPRISRFQEKDA